ncbi:hypothetical protein [Siphonobacter sp. SORGH_AS_0500]|uniref:hypothetical protein n=1 Tax=Siphonobacter sp. SORGH_AS_0500 TaxID=1864824 RepID=UPI002857FBA1|nr:hypothetical protein [Siphonobacter sp. SORGH_AS_0500]MDR6197577.1 hypothetical protein [Siphonobacter sp. SORGH_AS_0500]
MNTKITLFKFVTSLVAFTFLGNHVHAQTGNVGIGTTSPATKLHVVSTGTGGTTVIPSNTSNINLRLQNTGNGQAVIQHFSALDASGALKQAVLGVNPTFNSGNGVFVLSRDGSNDFVLNLTNGNLGIGQGTPAAKLDVLGNIKIADGTQGARKVLTSDANGLASWQTSGFTAPADPYTTPYVSASGSGTLDFNNNGWNNNGITVLKLDQVSDANNVYDPSTGIITIKDEGVYSFIGFIYLTVANASGTAFDGSGGELTSYIRVKSNGASDFTTVANSVLRVFKGSSIPFGVNRYNGTVNGTLYLKAGDQIAIFFKTYGTGNMDGQNGNGVSINKDLSMFKLFKQ